MAWRKQDTEKDDDKVFLAKKDFTENNIVIMHRFFGNNVNVSLVYF